MPPSQDITAESFKFKRPIQSTGKRKGPSLVQQRKRPRRGLSQQQPITTTGNRSFPTTTTMDLSSLEDSDHEPVSSTERAHVLKGVVMVIDRQLWEAQRLCQLAIAMGAETSEAMNKRVTHVVHSPITTAGTSKQQSSHTRVPRLVTQALGACKRLVSPQWVMDCYEQKKRLGESYYPFDTDPSRVAHRLSYQLEEEEDENHVKKNRKIKKQDDDDNPFQIDPKVYQVSSDEEEEEENQPEEVRRRRQHQEDDHTTDDEGEGDQHVPSAEYYDEEQSIQNAQQPPDSPTQSQADGQQQNDDEEDEVLLRRKEKRSAAISKILQAVKESKERKQQQQQQQQQQYHQHPHQQQTSETHEEIGSSSLGTDDLQVGYLGTEERMQVWYGEQSFYNNDDISLLLSSPPKEAAAGSSTSNRRRVTTTLPSSSTRRISRQKK
ncbi:hypothetical protein BDA99DRAFT_542482 [Phascolomyces articulosus]|uniref:BRCT domain-containing protein n=1 Tax=Phascolomyces articulosus TaxID=60185 RepID=A0AAD5PAA7_9FUNG|nr:hypothetical protein BDA99DRAFT_542482 [Phascolomyces articulosus]